MCKAADRSMSIHDVRVLESTGGKSGAMCAQRACEPADAAGSAADALFGLASAHGHGVGHPVAQQVKRRLVVQAQQHGTLDETLDHPWLGRVAAFCGSACTERACVG